MTPLRLDIEEGLRYNTAQPPQERAVASQKHGCGPNGGQLLQGTHKARIGEKVKRSLFIMR